MSQRVADLVINNEDQIFTELLFQTQIRKAGKLEHATGGGKESLHSESSVVPDSFFLDIKACVGLIHSAMCLQYKEDKKGRAWFRNPDLTAAKIGRQPKPFCAMLASVFMNCEQWVNLVQSHYDNLADDDKQPPVVTEGMMADYFYNIEGMRTLAFGLVCFLLQLLILIFAIDGKGFQSCPHQEGGRFSETFRNEKGAHCLLLKNCNAISDQAHQSGLILWRIIF